MAAEREWQSHAPQRPLPQPSQRALEGGPSFFVALDGEDTSAGTQEKPWRTIGHAAKKLKPGDTLVIRGGVYHEHITATLTGTSEKPITIRGYPGELAIIDGGLKEFLESPATAWEPDPEGVAGEFRSTKAYLDVGARAGDLRIGLLGNFADTMTPLHGYWSHGDLQSDNPYFNLNDGTTKNGNVGGERHVYCGPGVWFDDATGRMHCRLAHTKLPGLGDDNYRGETDPRKVPLIIAPWASGSVLRLNDSRHVRVQDLVLRGARLPTLWIDGGSNIELDGVTAYGGQACMKVDGVNGFRMCHCACRGLAAPWTFRGALKYRSIESRLFTTGGWDPSGADGRTYEMAYCEFTDSVDGVFVGNIDTLAFHHNLVENVSDDGVFVTAATAYDGTTPGGNHKYYQNRFARILTVFAFGVGHGRQKIIRDGPPGRWGDKQLGAGLDIYRNVFDFRRPVWYYWPTGPDAPQELTSRGRFAGDHVSPGWEPMRIVHNTLITADPPRYEYGTEGFSRAAGNGSRRAIYNNILCQIHGLPGQYLPDGSQNYEADGNLLWSVSDGATTSSLPKPRYPRDQTPPKAEWAAHDRFADPRFVAFDSDWHKPVDLRLRDNSSAVNGGVDVPEASRVVDPLKEFDSGRPDVGAIPLGVEPWRVGCNGRLDVGGNPVSTNPSAINVTWFLSPAADASTSVQAKPVAIVTGYPAFDAPLIAYAFRKRGSKVDEFERQWVDPHHFSRYSVIVVDGSFARAGLKTTRFADDELPLVRKYLEDGGTLWLCRERADIFGSDVGKQFLSEIIGPQPRDSWTDYQVRLPTHPWVSHLAEPGADTSWLAKAAGGVRFERGEAVIGTSSGKSLLGRARFGKGQIIYMGWSPSSALPNGRVPPTVADEHRFGDQMQVITKIANGLVDIASK